VLCKLYLGAGGDGIRVKTEPDDITEYHPLVDDHQSTTGRLDCSLDVFSLKSFITVDVEFIALPDTVSLIVEKVS